MTSRGCGGVGGGGGCRRAARPRERKRLIGEDGRVLV